MANSRTDQLNGWSSFSNTTTVTIIAGSTLFAAYVLLDQVSSRLDSVQASSLTSPGNTIANSEFLTLLQAIFFFGLFPAMYFLRYQIRNSDGFDRNRFRFFSTQNPSFATFLGLLAGGFILFCVQYTIRSMMFG